MLALLVTSIGAWQAPLVPLSTPRCTPRAVATAATTWTDLTEDSKCVLTTPALRLAVRVTFLTGS